MFTDIGGVKSTLARRNNFSSRNIISRVSTCFEISYLHMRREEKDRIVSCLSVL